MKITAIIADDLRPEGWPECYTATKWDASPADQRHQIENILFRFNHDRRRGEFPRRLLSVTSEEIDEGDAFNMGMNAYNQGKERDADNYWPASHPNHVHWFDGWEECRAMDADEYKEGDGDE